MSQRSVLALMAHPDDAEICMGGTLAHFAHSGTDVHIGLVCLPDQPEVRLAEAKRGADILGATLHLIEIPGLPATWQVEDVPVYKLVTAFDALRRKTDPSIVFTHWIGDTHYDHVLVSRATLSMTRRLQLDLYMCEQPNQYAPFAAPMDLNTYVDVSAYMDKRVESIHAHYTQTHNRTYEDHVRARARYHGERIGCEYAEAFHCVVQRMRIGS